MTDSELTIAGYRRYSGPGPWTSADAFYQRTVRSDDGTHKLYFLNVGM